MMDRLPDSSHLLHLHPSYQVNPCWHIRSPSVTKLSRSRRKDLPHNPKEWLQCLRTRPILCVRMVPDLRRAVARGLSHSAVTLATASGLAGSSASMTGYIFVNVPANTLEMMAPRRRTVPSRQLRSWVRRILRGLRGEQILDSCTIRGSHRLHCLGMCGLVYNWQW